MATQLITPNPNVPCTPGECLVYVQDTFSVAAKYPTATAAWTASNTKHADQNFLDDLWVPVWFSLQDNPDGHVALRQPDGTVWSASSPTDTTPVHHASMDDLESYYSGKLTYLGWSEDVEDTPIISFAESTPIILAPGQNWLTEAADAAA
jgi:hypothetical protein